MRNVQVFIESNGSLTPLDLYGDEGITVTDTIQDIRDISKVFTAYSQTFMLPATENNNKTFKHYYNPDVVGFDARFKANALIKLDGVNYKKGKLSLQGASMQHGQVKSYEVVFYGETIELNEVLGDDTLRQLSGTAIDNYSFDYTLDNIQDGFTKGLTYTNGQMVAHTGADDTYDVCFPFISASSYYFYDTADNPVNKGNVDTRNIYFQAGGNVPKGIHYDDLKPAIRVRHIVDAIAEKYRFNFSTHFLTQANKPYNDLFLWLQRESGTLSDQIGLQEFDFNIGELTYSSGTEQRTTALASALASYLETTIDYVNNRRWTKYYKEISFDVTTRTGFTSTAAPGSRVEVYVDVVTYRTLAGGLEEVYKVEYDKLVAKVPFQGEDTVSVTAEMGAPSSKLYSKKAYNVKIKLIAPTTITNALITNVVINNTYRESFTRSSSRTLINSGTYADKVLSSNVTLTESIAHFMPKMKVIDFLTGLFKMFNLTAYFDGQQITVRTLDEYYFDGKEIDITQYIDTATGNVKRGQIYSKLDLKFASSSTFAVNAANELQLNTSDNKLRRNFGEELIDNVNELFSLEDTFDGKVYALKLPFEKIMYERMTNQDVNDTSKSTVFQWGWFVNKNESPTAGKPLFFYPTEKSCVSMFDRNVKEKNGGDWNNGAGYINDLGTTQQYITPILKYIRPNNQTNGNEYSLHWGDEFDEYTARDYKNSLFRKFYLNYISRIYDIQSRIVIVNANLPTQILNKYRLNDIFIIHSRKYYINKVDTNLNNGKTTLELIYKV